jgi:hypothetical protein
MKIILSLSLIAMLVSLNGCMTYSAVQDAKGHQDKTMWLWREPTSGDSDNKSRPAYYLLLPLTVPADIVTCPFQALFWLWLSPG